MQSHIGAELEHQGNSSANEVAQRQMLGVEGKGPDAVQLKAYQEMTDGSPAVTQLKSYIDMADGHAERTIQMMKEEERS